MKALRLVRTQLAPAALAMGIALAIASLALLINGNNPLTAYKAMWSNLDGTANIVTVINDAAVYYVAGVALAPRHQVTHAQTGSLSLGDRIWFDINANGLIDGGEGGVANLTVRLFKVVQQPGSYQEFPMGTTTTDAGDKRKNN